MAISKHEFYEGAALYQLIASGAVTTIRCESQVFVVNDSVQLYFKYCTKGRSPWSFTFTAAQRSFLQERAAKYPVVIGLICAADGIATLLYDSFCAITSLEQNTATILCRRKHGQHYLISGANGSVSKKIPPSMWPRLLV